MKQSDLSVGLEVAVVSGEGQYDRRPENVTKAVVREVGVQRLTYRRRNDGVRVQYVGEAPIYGSGQQLPDGTYVVSSKQVWMTWEEAEPLVTARKEEKERQQQTNLNRNTRKAHITEALHQRGCEGELEWLSHFLKRPSDRHGESDEKLLIGADTLEQLLGL